MTYLRPQFPIPISNTMKKCGIESVQKSSAFVHDEYNVGTDAKLHQYIDGIVKTTARFWEQIVPFDDTLGFRIPEALSRSAWFFLRSSKSKTPFCAVAGLPSQYNVMIVGEFARYERGVPLVEMIFQEEPIASFGASPLTFDRSVLRREIFTDYLRSRLAIYGHADVQHVKIEERVGSVVARWGNLIERLKGHVGKLETLIDRYKKPVEQRDQSVFTPSQDQTPKGDALMDQFELLIAGWAKDEEDETQGIVPSRVDKRQSKKPDRAVDEDDTFPNAVVSVPQQTDSEEADTFIDAPAFNKKPDHPSTIAPNIFQWRTLEPNPLDQIPIAVPDLDRDDSDPLKNIARSDPFLKALRDSVAPVTENSISSQRLTDNEEVVPKSQQLQRTEALQSKPPIVEEIVYLFQMGLNVEMERWGDVRGRESQKITANHAWVSESDADREIIGDRSIVFSLRVKMPNQPDLLFQSNVNYYNHQIRFGPDPLKNDVVVSLEDQYIIRFSVTEPHLTIFRKKEGNDRRPLERWDAIEIGNCRIIVEELND